eukprot:12629416-Alexandrium_andersonii.AAC.1
MRENEALWPNSTRWGKKSALDWLQLERRYGKRMSVTNRELAEPFEYGQYMIDSTGRMGWSKQDAEAQWNMMEIDTNIERGNFGLNDCLRLWVPKSMKLRDNTRFIEGVTVEGGAKN